GVLGRRGSAPVTWRPPLSSLPSQPLSSLPSQPHSSLPSQPLSSLPSQSLSSLPSQPLSSLPSQPLSSFPSQLRCAHTVRDSLPLVSPPVPLCAIPALSLPHLSPLLPSPSSLSHPSPLIANSCFPPFHSPPSQPHVLLPNLPFFSPPMPPFPHSTARLLPSLSAHLSPSLSTRNLLSASAIRSYSPPSLHSPFRMPCFPTLTLAAPTSIRRATQLPLVRT
ncbi:unnamed protein product, partial [Closterium sp. NIES-53]